MSSGFAFPYFSPALPSHHNLPPPPPSPSKAPPPHHFLPSAPSSPQGPPTPLPPHLVPPPPSPSSGNNPTVIVVVFVSLGGLFFLAFLSVALCCFVKKKKKKILVQETDHVDTEEHIRVQEAIIPGPHCQQAVILSIDDDVRVHKDIKKSETLVGGEELHSMPTHSPPCVDHTEGPHSGTDPHNLEHKR